MFFLFFFILVHLSICLCFVGRSGERFRDCDEWNGMRQGSNLFCLVCTLSFCSSSLAKGKREFYTSVYQRLLFII